MSVGILTLFHHNYNYGAHLQALALSVALNSMSIPNQILDFDWNAYYQTPKNSNISFFQRVLSFIKRKKFNFFYTKKLNQRKKAFDDFDTFQIRNVSPTVTVKTIAALSNRYKAIIVGSDQVWRFINRDKYANEVFLLKFFKRSKMSYAASLGLSSLPKEAENLFEQNLPHFDYVSVREKKAKQLLQPFFDTEIPVVLDPTLLLKKEDWNNYKEPLDGLPEKYILCYFIDGTAWFRDYAKNIARKWNLPLVTIPFVSMGYNLADANFSAKKMYDVSPAQFLTMIDQATLVLTDSFHALVFSLLFNKKFQVFLRKEGLSGGMSERILDLLQNANMLEMLVDPYSPSYLEEEKVFSYECFEKYVAASRNYSLDYLAQIKKDLERT